MKMTDEVIEIVYNMATSPAAREDFPNLEGDPEFGQFLSLARILRDHLKMHRDDFHFPGEYKKTLAAIKVFLTGNYRESDMTELYQEYTPLYQRLYAEDPNTQGNIRKLTWLKKQIETVQDEQELDRMNLEIQICERADKGYQSLHLGMAQSQLASKYLREIGIDDAGKRDIKRVEVLAFNANKNVAEARDQLNRARLDRLNFRKEHHPRLNEHEAETIFQAVEMLYKARPAMDEHDWRQLRVDLRGAILASDYVDTVEILENSIPKGAEED